MDTNKGTILILLISISVLFTGCPSETFCDLDEESNIISKTDAIVLSPEKRTFKKGDTIQLLAEIPSKGMDNGTNYDIFKRLSLSSSEKTLNIDALINENETIVKKGQLIDSEIILNYNSIIDSYEFSIEIILARVGSYNLPGDFVRSAFNKDVENCEYITVRTNIKGINEEGFHEFTVEE